MITLERHHAPHSPTTSPLQGDLPANRSEVSDAALVVAIGRYDEAALEEAYERHGNAVFALARRLLSNRDMAEEVTQEIFLRLWNRPQRFDPERGSLRAFLLSDTHGRSIDVVRSERARREREAKESRMMPRETTDIEGEVWAKVASEQVRTAIATLSDGERRAIELAYFGGYTYREVAEMLGQPEGTVKSRIRTGMKRLKAALTAEGVMPS
jgi:RNA polymerase sigma-70 factor (ECF subfamily)